MRKMEHAMYFAYGSNMNLDQMAYRCPAAEAVCTAKLEGYELFFAGRSGNGVASIRPKQGGTVVGVLWKLTEACEKSLDHYEGVPFPVSWTVKMKKKQKETQDILSYHSQAAGCSDKARAKASGGRQPIEECGRTGL